MAKDLDWRIPDTKRVSTLGGVLAAVSLVGYLLVGLPILVIVVPLAASLCIGVTLAAHRSLLRAQEERQAQLQAVNSLHALLPLRAPLPAMTRWAAAPDLATTLVTEILRTRPKTIVEIGSGVSTLVDGYTLEKLGEGGKVIALDHDRAWCDRTVDNVKLHGLEDTSRVVHAPLVDHEFEGKTWKWYALDDLPAETRIDLLLVDGPPVKTQDMARYPALPLLAPYLSDDAVIVLDDADRDSERDVVDRWLREFGHRLELERLPTLRGTVILRWRKDPTEP